MIKLPPYALTSQHTNGSQALRISEIDKQHPACRDSVTREERALRVYQHRRHQGRTQISVVRRQTAIWAGPLHCA
jgi:hypothetical protein